VRAFALGCAKTRFAKLRLAIRGLAIPWTGARVETRTAAAESGLNLGCKTFQLYTIAKAYEKYCKIQAILRRYQCPPTHIYSFWFFDTALAATWLRSDYPTARAIARAHRYDVYANENRMRFLPLRQFMLQGLDAVLACSNDGANYLRERYGADAQHVSTCYLGTEKPSGLNPELTNDERYGMAPSRVIPCSFRIVSCSRVEPVKRVELLSRALNIIEHMIEQDKKVPRNRTSGGNLSPADVPRALPSSITWTHYGEGSQFAAVKTSTRSLRHVHVELPGGVENSTVLEDYASRHADLFVNVSSSEGIPISIMEATSYGIPVLATDVGGSSELVIDGVNGKLISSDATADDIAMAILAFARSDTEQMHRFRYEAHELWSQRFTIHANVTKVLAVLEGDSTQ
ncbi:glycosyltransferase, partial [Bifidobacterium animalis]|uniref:glycosyltransferase n=2 Tax=Bifidobacterium animalis TaxID=28025 RepID=UPI001BCCC49F